MKVFLRYPRGSEGFDETKEMPAVPRVGDSLYIGLDDEGDEFEVRTVVWYPDQPEFDAYVVLGR